MQHRNRLFDESRYSEPVNYGLAAWTIISVLLVILGVVMVCVHWFAGWTLSFFVPGVILGIVVVGFVTFEAEGLKGKRRSVYDLYRELERKSRDEIKLDPQSLHGLDDEKVNELYTEFERVKREEDKNRETREKNASPYAQVLERAERRRKTLAHDTQTCQNAVLYEGWTTTTKDGET